METDEILKLERELSELKNESEKVHSDVVETASEVKNLEEELNELNETYRY